MADDILLTPEEQDEKARQWFKDNGLALITGIALGLAAIFGYNQYKAQKQTDAESASLLFSEIIEQVAESDIIDISDKVAKLKTDYAKTSYAAKAVLVNAAELSKTDLTAAIPEYQWVRENSQEIGIQHTAKIRQAKIYLAQGDLDIASSLANEKPYDSFASHYLEILGDVAVQKGDLEQAYDYYDQAREQLLSTDATYASVLGLKMAPLPKPAEEESDDSN